MTGFKSKKAAAQDKLAQPKQEPVAVHQFRLVYSADWYDGHPDPENGHGPYETRTLYTTPPQRTWVDLTDEDISEIAINNPPMVHEFARAVLAKSKERNT